MKKALSIILAILMIVSTIPFAIAAETTLQDKIGRNEYENIPKSYALTNEIKDLSGETTFKIDEPAILYFGFEMLNTDQRSSGATPMPYALNCEINITYGDESSGWLDNGKPDYTKAGGEFEYYKLTITEDMLDAVGGEMTIIFKARAAIYPNTPFEDLQQTISNKYVHVYTSKCNHTGGEADCLNLAICTICSNPYGKTDASKHNYDLENGVLTRPSDGLNEDLNSVYIKGYYTYTCTICGDTYTEDVEGADTSACNDLYDKVVGYGMDNTLTQAAKDEIRSKFENILNNNTEILDEMSFIRTDLVASDQPLVDKVTEELQKIVDEVEAKTESGEYLKADYTEIDEVIAAVDEALKAATISEEMANELADIKADLDALKEKDDVTMADVYELLERAKAIKETMDNCANEKHTDINSDNLCDNGCGTELVLIEGESYAVLGDVTNTGVKYGKGYSDSLAAGCYKAGDGYVVIKDGETGTEMLLYNATIDVREKPYVNEYDKIAICVLGNLKLDFIGTNNVYGNGLYALVNFSGSEEDAELEINGAEDAVLNVYGIHCYWITIKSGTVNAYGSGTELGFAIYADKYLTVQKDAVVTAVGGLNDEILISNVSILSSRGMTVEGVLNAITFEFFEDSKTIKYLVHGDVTAVQDVDLSAIIDEFGSEAAIELVIPEGASLTVPENLTINLDSFTSVDIKGELIVKGTLICTHKGGTATCAAQAECTVCGTAYGSVSKENHTGNNTTVDKKEATCGEDGYTGDTVCECGETIAKGTVISATGKHNGGTATCKDKAVCGTCGQSYGEVNSANHVGGTEIRGAKEATETENGYTGDKHCKDCDDLLEKGSVIPATGSTTPDEPDEPTVSVEDCECLCHADGFFGAIFSFLIKLFSRIFGADRICDCGLPH